MNMANKLGVFEEKLVEYCAGDKKQKSEILRWVVGVTGLTRKSCIKRFRRLQMKDPCSHDERGRPRYYTPDCTAALFDVWEIGSEACGENLHPMISEYIDTQLAAGAWRHDEVATHKLRKMSVASVKRCVGSFQRTRRNFGGKSTTQKSSVISMVPIRMDGWDKAETGVTQIDTVAHCGAANAGDFVFTTNGTDVATMWGTRRAQWNKGQEATKASLDAMRKDSPFPWTEIHPDSGSEFINALNDLYDVLTPFLNHWIASRRIISKERIGARWKVTREKVAKTPYQRVLERNDVSEEVKNKLRTEHATLNPATMKKEIDRRTKRVHDMERRYGNPPKLSKSAKRASVSFIYELLRTPQAEHPLL